MSWYPILQPIVRLSLLGLVLACPSSALAATVDLSRFDADPGVTIASLGRSAILREDPPFGVVALINDPGAGGERLIVPAAGASLSLDYQFDQGPGGRDQFSVRLIDALTGRSLGPDWELVTQVSSAGPVSFDLSRLEGRECGLVFELLRLPGDATLDSVARIRDLTLTGVPRPQPIPVAGAGSSLFLITLLVLMARRALLRASRVKLIRSTTSTERSRS